jgi:RNA polymerase sigma factor (sigma-70 family)
MTAAVDEFSDLLTRARTGDEAAVKQLVQQYEGIVRRAASGLLGQAMRPYLDSLDLVQSVHRSLLIGLRHDKFDISTPNNLIALALTMVRRKIARHWRKLKHQPSAQAPVSVNDTKDALSQVPDTQTGPASQVVFSDEMTRLMAELDPTDRRLIELRLQGHSTADVARLLGVDSRFLRVRLGRLRKRLQERGLLNEWL